MSYKASTSGARAVTPASPPPTRTPIVEMTNEFLHRLREVANRLDRVAAFLHSDFSQPAQENESAKLEEAEPPLDVRIERIRHMLDHVENRAVQIMTLTSG